MTRPVCYEVPEVGETWLFYIHEWGHNHRFCVGKVVEIDTKNHVWARWQTIGSEREYESLTFIRMEYRIAKVATP